MLRSARAGVASLVVLFLFIPGARADLPLEFHLSYRRSATAGPFTGRVYVMLFSKDEKALRSPTWFNTEPFFARDVKNWGPGEKLVFDSRALGFPVPLNNIKPGTYTIQAVLDQHPNDISFSTAEGNLYGITRRELDPAKSGPVELTLDQVYHSAPFGETERVKFIEIESKLLTAFHGRPTHLRAAVVLPTSFKTDPKRTYPVVYEIPGFSGTHASALSRARMNVTDVGGVEMLWVVLDPSCRHGHHVFADSANNGPCGQALIEELIPAIEQKFRGIGKPAARFTTGHSSGGWSSLWLQVRYPDFFGGCWSTAPDPVDFTDFQRIDIYKAGVNMFRDEKGEDRPLARSNGKVVLRYRPFSEMEDVMGHGGQLRSFEAVFGARGPDGEPTRLWDRKTGVIDPEVARTWEAYDIRLVLQRNWKTLGPKLAGKIHVYMGDQDTFYLEGATRSLKEALKALGSDAVVELFPGKNHGSLMDNALRARIAREMAAQFRAEGLRR
jgi:S-formylglutathione hydrolase FrmB